MSSDERATTGGAVQYLSGAGLAFFIMKLELPDEYLAAASLLLPALLAGLNKLVPWMLDLPIQGISALQCRWSHRSQLRKAKRALEHAKTRVGDASLPKATQQKFRQRIGELELLIQGLIEAGPTPEPHEAET